jgi:hypothetical protein
MGLWIILGFMFFGATLVYLIKIITSWFKPN